MSAVTTAEVRERIDRIDRMRRAQSLTREAAAAHHTLTTVALPLAEERDALAAEVARLRRVADGARQAWADMGTRADAAEAEVGRMRARLDAGTYAADVPRREFLGRLVRLEWMRWAREQPAPKASWLTPWEGLTEPEREVDRRIGEVVAGVAAPLASDAFVALASLALASGLPATATPAEVVARVGEMRETMLNWWSGSGAAWKAMRAFCERLASEAGR